MASPPNLLLILAIVEDPKSSPLYWCSPVSVALLAAVSLSALKEVWSFLATFENEGHCPTTGICTISDPIRGLPHPSQFIGLHPVGLCTCCLDLYAMLWYAYEYLIPLPASVAMIHGSQSYGHHDLLISTACFLLLKWSFFEYITPRSHQRDPFVRFEPSVIMVYSTSRLRAGGYIEIWNLLLKNRWRFIVNSNPYTPLSRKHLSPDLAIRLTPLLWLAPIDILAWMNTLPTAFCPPHHLRNALQINRGCPALSLLSMTMMAELVSRHASDALYL